MRITTQMLNESARRAGLPIHNNSLLNILNNDSSQSDLLSALSRKTNKASDILAKNNFEKLEKAAGQLQKKSEVFMAEGEDSLFEKIKKSGNEADKQTLYTDIEELVDLYNDTSKQLKSSSDGLNGYYYQMLKETAVENKEALGNIGITILKDGTLSLDKEKMKEADIDSIEKVLGAEGTFSAKTAFLADRIADNAQANAESITNQYNSDGNIYSSILNKYDFRG